MPGLEPSANMQTDVQEPTGSVTVGATDDGVQCEFCQDQGHPIKFCRVFIEMMASLHAQTKSGALTAAQVAEQLNV